MVAIITLTKKKDFTRDINFDNMKYNKNEALNLNEKTFAIKRTSN